MTTATETKVPPDCAEIAKILWEIAKGNTPQMTDEEMSVAILDAMQNTTDEKLIALLGRAGSHFDSLQTAQQLEAEIAQLTARRKLLQPNILAQPLLKCLASDLRQAAKT